MSSYASFRTTIPLSSLLNRIRSIPSRIYSRRNFSMNGTCPIILRAAAFPPSENTNLRFFSSVNCSRLSNNFMELFVSFHHLASIPEYYFQLTFNSFILSWRNFIFNNFRRTRVTIIIFKKTRTHTYII